MITSSGINQNQDESVSILSVICEGYFVITKTFWKFCAINIKCEEISCSSAHEQSLSMLSMECT